MNIKITVVLLITLFQVQLAKGQSTQFQKFIEEYLTSFPNNAEIAIGIIDSDNTYKMVRIPHYSLPPFRCKPYHVFRGNVYHHSGLNLTSYSAAKLTSYSA